uniref:Sodium/calcium exchanger membrane region domain-containing protein n=1 Tax=Chelonoidis abingdonii TaxID=106734 RepID=A0A8C0G6X9_CHEAB
MGKPRRRLGGSQVVSCPADGDKKLSAEEEEAWRIAEMGKPILGENCRLEVIIEESYDFKNTVDKLIKKTNLALVIGTHSWREQFLDAITVSAGDEEEEEDGREEKLPSCFDYVMHFLTVFWKVLFACVPPTEYWNGWACFSVSILVIGLLTALIGDLASHFGCTVGLKDSVNAVVFVALGTSIPGTEPGPACRRHRGAVPGERVIWGTGEGLDPSPPAPERCKNQQSDPTCGGRNPPPHVGLLEGAAHSGGSGSQPANLCVPPTPCPRRVTAAWPLASGARSWTGDGTGPPAPQPGVMPRCGHVCLLHVYTFCARTHTHTACAYMRAHTHTQRVHTCAHTHTACGYMRTHTACTHTHTLHIRTLHTHTACTHTHTLHIRTLHTHTACTHTHTHTGCAYILRMCTCTHVYCTCIHTAHTHIH